jgi:hypothetical protein
MLMMLSVIACLVEVNDNLTLRILQWEPFQTLVDTLAAQQNIPVNDIMLSLNDVTVRPSETPASVKLKSADIIGK